MNIKWELTWSCDIIQDEPELGFPEKILIDDESWDRSALGDLVTMDDEVIERTGVYIFRDQDRVFEIDSIAPLRLLWGLIDSFSRPLAEGSYGGFASDQSRVIASLGCEWFTLSEVGDEECWQLEGESSPFFFKIPSRLGKKAREANLWSSIRMDRLSFFKGLERLAVQYSEHVTFVRSLDRKKRGGDRVCLAIAPEISSFREYSLGEFSTMLLNHAKRLRSRCDQLEGLEPRLEVLKVPRVFG